MSMLWRSAELKDDDRNIQGVPEISGTFDKKKLFPNTNRPSDGKLDTGEPCEICLY